MALDFKAYENYAVPGLNLVKERDSKVLAHRSIGSIARNYNFILGEARQEPDLEALVLVHQDAELVNPDFCEIVRRELSDPEVAVVGCAGAVGVRSIAWWEGGVNWASFNHRYEELGGGELPAMTWFRDQIPPYVETGEVDSIDGFVMVVSKWAVENLEFDETLGNLHGYDFDFCSQARLAGKKVKTADFQAIHHHSLDVINDPSAWMDTYIRMVEKWEGKLPNVREVPGDLKLHALRSEAEAAYTRARLNSYHHKLEAVEDQLAEVANSTSWRLTAPFRAIGRLVRRPKRRQRQI